MIKECANEKYLIIFTNVLIIFDLLFIYSCLFSLSMIPYFHFMMIYSNFLGFTGLPNNKFGLQEAMMSPEDLAVASSPNPATYESSNATDLFPQGSTLLTNGITITMSKPLVIIQGTVLSLQATRIHIMIIILQIFPSMTSAPV